MKKPYTIIALIGIAVAAGHLLHIAFSEDPQSTPPVQVAHIDPAVQEALAWKDAIYSEELDDYLASVGIEGIDARDRFEISDQVREALQQEGNGDCWSRSFAVADNIASGHVGSDQQALAQWVNRLCIFDEVHA